MILPALFRTASGLNPDFSPRSGEKSKASPRHSNNDCSVIRRAGFRALVGSGFLFVPSVRTSGLNPGSEPSSVPVFSLFRPCELLVSFLRRHSQAVRQRSAKPSSPVRFRVAPPKRKHPEMGCFRFGNTTPPSDRAPPALARSGIRSASAARRSASSLARRRARGYSPNGRNSEQFLKVSLFLKKVFTN